MLRGRGLTLRYRGAAAPAVRDASLVLGPQAWLAVSGPSGCGKSSLLRLLAGLREPDSGSIALDGAPMPRGGAPRRAWHRQVLLLPQDTSRAFNPALTLGRQFRAAMGLHGIGADAAARDAIAAECLVACGVPPGVLHRHADGLSGGQRQRAALARLLCLRPRVLLLDEPTAALDPATALETCRLLDSLRRARGGPSILAATHEACARAHADQVLTMRDGRLEAQVAELGGFRPSSGTPCAAPGP
ncbi:ABC transporter ATP-binding protein [Humitalea sp. 24SJ18S-53]|uniref:ABC transporter ATP-binding protein n=1 Tax=Humitalea sp. 24SJ18S-53 TaxID=3422307 RepID=UPI003D67CE9A